MDEPSGRVDFISDGTIRRKGRDGRHQAGCITGGPTSTFCSPLCRDTWSTASVLLLALLVPAGVDGWRGAGGGAWGMDEHRYDPRHQQQSS